MEFFLSSPGSALSTAAQAAPAQSAIRITAQMRTATAGKPTAPGAQVLVATWCCSVGTTWTLELHEPNTDTTLGTLVDWISSGVPTSQPQPDESLTHQLLADHGMQLYPDPSVGPRTHNRRSIGYVRRVVS